MPLSTYFANEILNWIKGTDTDTAPTTVYVALYDGNPGDDGSGGTDVTEDVRAAGRVAITFGSIATKAMSNSADVDFGTSDGAADLTHFGVWDDATAGNLLGYNALITPRTVEAADPVKFATGSLVINLANP